ncbi:hypothetical protein CCAX7_36200 [Capsulimonas corticalis]|uniref:Uncharacterized protein n=1 Tax=Capsulimonas corticalis TaxID=2219043 RepID=A0A402D6W7_9BACT|nr:hypothetical protein CCAX7_36200 [Capsulimonas corticalis]
MARLTASSPYGGRFVSPTEFIQKIEKTLLERCASAPDDQFLWDLALKVTSLRSTGRPGAAEDELRKWYLKEQK